MKLRAKARFPYDRYDRCDRWTFFQRSQRSYGNHSPAIAATTIAEIKLFLSQRLLSLRSLRSLESGFHMVAMIAAIAELFFLIKIVPKTHSLNANYVKKFNPRCARVFSPQFFNPIISNHILVILSHYLIMASHIKRIITLSYLGISWNIIYHI